MASTQIKGNQILDKSIQAVDISLQDAVETKSTVSDDYIVISNGQDIKKINASQYIESIKSGFNVTLGGSLTVNSSGYVKWTNRYTVISNGNGNEFATSGYFYIETPMTGTILGVGGASNVTATSNGIPLTDWQALYYILPTSSGSTSLPGNFRVASFSSTLSVPQDWLLICVVNGNNHVYYFPNGIKLNKGQTIDPSLYDSVNADMIDGIHLSDLQDRFVNSTGDTMTGQLTMSNTGILTDYLKYNAAATPTLTSGTRRWNQDFGTTELMLTGGNVTIQDGQELVLRVFNSGSTTITNGSPVTIVGGYGKYEAVDLAIAYDHTNTKFFVDGVATENIPVGSLGYITYFGRVNNLNLSQFNNGDRLFLSQTIAGKLVLTSDLNISGRTCQIGTVINNSATEGILRLDILNEKKTSWNTESEIQTYSVNNTSTGVYDFGGITSGSTTTFNISQVKGWVVDNETDPTKPTVTYVYYPGGNGLTTPYLTGYTITYIFLDKNNSIVLQPTIPTPQQRREMIFLGKVGHANKQSITSILPETDSMISPLSQVRDMFIPIPLINDKIVPYVSTGLTVYTTSGNLFGFGINFSNDKKNPNQKFIPANLTGMTFQYRTQISGTTTNRTTIDTNHYDLNGIVTLCGVPSKQATNQRIYLLQSGEFRIQYGQNVYPDLATAKLAINTESFTPFPGYQFNSILIGIISVETNCTNLNDSSSAQLFIASKFGDAASIGGGAAGGGTTATFQSTYNNSSSNPQITTSSGIGAFSLRRGSSNEFDSVIEIQNGSGIVTSKISGSGDISGNTINSTVATGTSPLGVKSTTLVSNLNADMLDGVHLSGLVQTYRNITINGSTQNLSSDRTWNVGTITGITITAGTGLTGGGTVSSTTGPTNLNITIGHVDVSAASSINSNNSNGVVLQDLTIGVSPLGHVTGATVGTIDLDTRYFTESESISKFAKLTGDTFTGSVNIGGDLVVTGNITQNGSSYETHANKIFTTGDTIVLRDGAVSGLAVGSYVGLVAKLYDGTNDGVLVFDKNGVARVGDMNINTWTGTTQAIATREDSPTSNGFAYWNSSLNRFDTKLLSNSDISGVVPSTRNITINGTSQNLSSDRTWNVGTITGITISASSGMTGGGTISSTTGPISGTLNLSHADTSSVGSVFTTTTSGGNVVQGLSFSFDTYGHVTSINYSPYDLDTRYSDTGHTHDSVYLKISGGTLTGALNFKNSTWNSMGDDAAIGDNNISGQIAIKSLNSSIPGIAFYNNSGTAIGNLTSNNGTLQWSGNNIWHSGNSNLYTIDWHANNVYASGEIDFGSTTGKCQMLYNSTENSIDFIIN